MPIEYPNGGGSVNVNASSMIGEFATAADLPTTGVSDGDVAYVTGYGFYIYTNNTWNIYSSTGNTPGTIVMRDSSGNFTSNVISANLNGNAGTSSKWASPMTLSLTGAVSGSASMDGSANVTLTTSATTIPVILTLDDTQVTTTSTSLTTVKKVRINNAETLSTMDIQISAWNSSSSAQTTIQITYNSQTYTQTTSATSETFFTFSDIPIVQSLTPQSISVLLETNTTGTTAYSQFFQIIGKV
ncbi:MAG: hypothetical protein M1542_08560 [Thermotogae bacterium]|jgi:hypothetical protein|nr:hypothetical protein [Thermotogota bacterium]